MAAGWILDPAARERWLLALASESMGAGGQPDSWRSRQLQLLTAMALGGGLYGLACGSWRGWTFALYVAIKLPLLLALTTLLTVAFQWVAAGALGLRLPFRAVLAASLGAIAIAAVVLGSLAPIAWLFTASAPAPTPEARTVHNLLYLLHTALVAGAGLLGCLALGRALRSLSGSQALARRVLLIWVIAFAFVGGEVAWLLRPFIGSVYQPVVFLRRDSFKRNVYEFIWNDILPWLGGSEPTPGKPKETS